MVSCAKESRDVSYISIQDLKKISMKVYLLQDMF
jgi:hypothetical protein